MYVFIWTLSTGLANTGQAFLSPVLCIRLIQQISLEKSLVDVLPSLLKIILIRVVILIKVACIELALLLIGGSLSPSGWIYAPEALQSPRRKLRQLVYPRS